MMILQLDPSRSNHSTISVLSLPERLTVEWSNVSVMADAEHPAGGAFTFQVTAAQPQRQLLHYTLHSQRKPHLWMASFQNNTPKSCLHLKFVIDGDSLLGILNEE